MLAKSSNPEVGQFKKREKIKVGCRCSDVFDSFVSTERVGLAIQIRLKVCGKNRMLFELCLPLALFCIDMGNHTRILYALIAGCSWLYDNDLSAQKSAFDADNEGWSATGDPANTIATWTPTGGNPGGHIRVVDAATGNLWYFSAPPRFRGNKCGAYGRSLRWEQFCSDTTQAHSPIGGRPDVVLVGGGLTLVYDLPYNPTTSWTAFEVLLREDAGWRINNLNGPAPTPDEFRAVLRNISSLRIRGEYRTGPDFGGLDNVHLEDSFRFDLDADNSSGISDDGFRADTLCGAPYLSPVADADLVLEADSSLDSIVLRLLLVKDAGQEHLTLTSPLPTELTLYVRDMGWLSIGNAGGASHDAFAQALRQIYYAHDSPSPTSGERLVAVYPYGDCGALGVRYTYLYLTPPARAGLSTDVILCPDAGPIDLFEKLGASATAGGRWWPDLPGGRFDPAQHAPGLYYYIVSSSRACPADTAAVAVAVEPALDLGADTVLCRQETLQLEVPPSLIRWQWSNGSRSPVLAIDAPGVFALEGSTVYCSFVDSIRVAFVECQPCPFYAPNAFSPNDDGVNDTWQISFACPIHRFQLQLFDRWGNLVFSSNDPKGAWNGEWGDMRASCGVYTWRAEWVVETPLGQERVRAAGDVLLMR